MIQIGRVVSENSVGGYNFSDRDLYNGTVTVQNIALTAKFNGAAETTDLIGLGFALWDSPLGVKHERPERNRGSCLRTRRNRIVHNGVRPGYRRDPDDYGRHLGFGGSGARTDVASVFPMRDRRVRDLWIP